MADANGRLTGKVAIVTGAGSAGEDPGTGDATAILFAREGAKVLLVDIDQGRAESTLRTIEGEGGSAEVFAADVTSAADCEAAVQAARDRFGGLHVLFNNVATYGRGSVVDVDPDDWDRTLTVNLKSMMLMSKYAVPAMAEGGGGSIIHVSSIDGVRGKFISPNVAYAASKGGALALAASMAIQHGRDGVRVNCIVPGMIWSAFVSSLTFHDMRELRRRASPLGTEGTSWDVAWAAVYLASDESRWVTGAALPVDGGILATQALSMWPQLSSGE